MFGFPIYAYFFVLAVVAALAARLLVGRVRDDPGSFPGWILYAVAIGFALAGIVGVALRDRQW